MNQKSHLSSLPLQIVLYFSGWYLLVFYVAEFALVIYKGVSGMTECLLKFVAIVTVGRVSDFQSMSPLCFLHGGTGSGYTSCNWCMCNGQVTVHTRTPLVKDPLQWAWLHWICLNKDYCKKLGLVVLQSVQGVLSNLIHDLLHAGLVLPYPGRNLAAEIILLLFLAILDLTRIFLGT